MAADDRIYQGVKAALIKDGWTIVDDPLKIIYKDVFCSPIWPPSGRSRSSEENSASWSKSRATWVLPSCATLNRRWDNMGFIERS